MRGSNQELPLLDMRFPSRVFTKRYQNKFSLVCGSASCRPDQFVNLRLRHFKCRRYLDRPRAYLLFQIIYYVPDILRRQGRSKETYVSPLKTTRSFFETERLFQDAKVIQPKLQVPGMFRPGFFYPNFLSENEKTFTN